jgi:polyhydroxybutyrate depolymerase
MTRFMLAVVGLWGGCAALAADPKRLEWTVGDAKREALVYAPAEKGKEPAPVVFVFHGHGGTMKNAAEKFAIHKHWPEAVCVYMQGLKTPTKNDPEGLRPGWQNAPGLHGDRDLAFFDEVLKTLKADYGIDEKRIYATGHSNGGGFTYALWAARGNVLAAVAPSAAGAGALRLGKDVTPLPCLHVAGEKDATVPFENQKKTMEAVRRLNGCDAEGKEWGKAGMLVGTVYPSKDGAPVVTLIHPGDHTFPPDAPPLIVKFFQEHARK